MKQRQAEDEARLFRESVKDATPLRPVNRIEPQRHKPSPIPFKRMEDEQAVLDELLRLAIEEDRGRSRFSLAGNSGTVPCDDGVYLRPGLPRDILRKLRRTHWVIQREIDLHGLSGDEAALETAEFIAAARRRGLRCVRIIHGKGLRSRGREPVLKGRVRRLLARRDDVLAFVEPRAAHGGGGAVIVLLAP